MHEPDGHLCQSLEFFFRWPQVEFHDMSTDKRLPIYLSLPRVDENQWAMYWRISPLLLDPTPSMMAYNSSQLMGDDNDRRSWLSWQVLFVEFGLISLTVFLDTSKYGVRGNVRFDDWRVWYDENTPGPRGPLIPLLDIMIRFLKEPGHPEYRPRDPGRDDNRAYPAKPSRNQPSDIPRGHVPEHYPKVTGFDPSCFEPDVEATPLVPAGISDGESFGEDPVVLPVQGVNPPVKSSVVLSTASSPLAPPGAAPQGELSYEPAVAQEDIFPGELTVEAKSSLGDAMAPTPTVGMDIATVLREGCSWALRSARYAAVFQQGQDLKTALDNILQQNAQVMYQRATVHLDARFGVNLSDLETSDGDNSSSGESPPKKRAPLAGAGPCGILGSSGDPSLEFAPAGSNEDEGVTPVPP
ncbi:unnamed protein product [Agarophyton chilense]